MLSFLNIPVVSASSSHHRKAHMLEKVTAPVSFPILMYHSISQISREIVYAYSKLIEHQMELLLRKDIYTLTPGEAYRVLTRQEVPVGKENKIVLLLLMMVIKTIILRLILSKEVFLHATIGMITDKINTPDMLSTNELKKLRKENWSVLLVMYRFILSSTL